MEKLSKQRWDVFIRLSLKFGSRTSKAVKSTRTMKVHFEDRYISVLYLKPYVLKMDVLAKIMLCCVLDQKVSYKDCWYSRAV